MASSRQARERSPENDEMIEASGLNSMGDVPAPGSEGRIHIQDLGFLDELPDVASSDDPAEGTGAWVVVLAHYLSGAGDDDNFTRGDVRRLSRIVPGYAANKNDPAVQARVKRIFSIKGVRVATREEQGQGHIELRLENESPDVQAERDRRIALEQENQILREKLQGALASQINMTPESAGSSQVAKDAVAGDIGTAPAVGTEAGEPAEGSWE